MRSPWAICKLTDICGVVRSFALWLVLGMVVAGPGLAQEVEAINAVVDLARAAAANATARPAEAGAKPAANTPPAKPDTAAEAAARRAMLSMPKDAVIPMNVGVGLYVQDVSKIAEGTGTFDASFDLQTRWRDSRLAFDAVAQGTPRQSFLNEAAVAKLAAIWTPRVVVANNGDKTPRIEHALFIESNGQVTHRQRIKGTFDLKFKTLPFPFDSQVLAISLISNHYSKNEIEFFRDRADRDVTGLREKFSVSGWLPQDLTFATSAVRGLSGEYFPKIDAQISVKRDSAPHIFSIFGPLLLILLIPTVMTLYIKADIAPRLTAWSASILALVAFSFTLGVRYPALEPGNLVTQSVSVAFAYQLFMVSLNGTLFYPAMAEKMADKHIVAELTLFCRWFIPLCLLGFFLTRGLLTALS